MKSLTDDMVTADDFLRIGRLMSPHGLDGTLKIHVTTDVLSRFAEGSRVFIEIKGKMCEYPVESFGVHKGKTAIVRFPGVDTREEAERISGSNVYILKSDAEKNRGFLSDNEFYYYDLIGLSVYKDGVLFGEVSDIVEAGSGHILEIADKEGGHFMIPFVDSMVDTSLLKDGRIDINPVAGLLEK